MKRYSCLLVEHISVAVFSVAEYLYSLFDGTRNANAYHGPHVLGISESVSDFLGF